MAVHMFRICAGPQSSWPQSDANLAVEDWMSNQSEWTADPVEHSMGSFEPQDGSAAWWQGDYRLTFESEPKSNLFQKLEDKLTDKPDWYRVGYHECDHDQSDRGGCAWDDVREWTAKDVTIPDAVPAFTVS